MRLDGLTLLILISSVGLILFVQFAELSKLEVIQEEVQILGGYVIHD